MESIKHTLLRVVKFIFFLILDISIENLSSKSSCALVNFVIRLEGIGSFKRE